MNDYSEFITNENLEELHSAISQLCFDVTEENITIESVKKYYQGNVAVKVFDISNALFNGDYEMALKALNDMVNYDNKGIDITDKFKYKEYNIDIVNIHNNIVIIGKDIGYSMDLVHGKTLQDFKSDVNYKEKKEIIKNAIKSLIDRLTQIDFLVYDLHLDNLMWDNDTNTLSLIDITENSFGRKRHEIVSNNETAKYDILRQV